MLYYNPQLREKTSGLCQSLNFETMDLAQLGQNISTKPLMAWSLMRNALQFAGNELNLYYFGKT